MNKGKFPISIVIPAFNEEKSIKDCLNSIVNQSTNLQYEVILVDNNSKDKTVEIAKTFQDKLNIRIIKEIKQGRGAARARGFNEAKGDIILSTDADTIVYPMWIDTLTKDIGDKVIAITTSCKIIDCSFLTNLVFNFIQPTMTLIYGSIFGNSWLFGFSFAISKLVYEKSGGFDTNLQAQEDFDLGYRVCKLGKIKFINKPVIVSGRRFKDGLLVGFYVYIKSFIEVFILKRKNIFLSNVR